MSFRLKTLCQIRATCILTSLSLFTLLFPCAGISGSFSVNPVRVELSEDVPNAVIHVENASGAPVTIQLTPLSWSQENNKDQLRPTRELLSTPQLFTLKPGATQLVRVGALRRPDAEKELAYRLLLEEIPSLPPPEFKGLQVALRISMPIFLKPPKETNERLQMTFTRDPGNKLNLFLLNKGNGAAQLSEIRLYEEASLDTPLGSYPHAVYVLPGQRRELAIRNIGMGSGQKLQVRAVMRGVPVEFHAVASPP